jgi:hypothetical protein
MLVRDLHEPVLDLRVGAACRRAVLVSRRFVGVAGRESSGVAVEGGGENSVWRVVGQPATIRSIAGRKPMSSIRSASSKTSLRM